MKNEFQGRRVLVVGLGKSGLAAAALLHELGAIVVLNDARTDVPELELWRERGSEIHLGAHEEALFTAVDFIVVSPGVPPLPALRAAQQARVPILSEVELAFRTLRGATIIAVTGTNGKSTVTTLLGEMAKRTGRPTFVGGNLGTPMTEVAQSDAAGPDGFVVVELSSFQLEHVERFRANVAVLLNVTDDHLDRYESFAEYAAAKGRIFHGQRGDDVAIVPAGDPLCESLAKVGQARVLRFGDLQESGDSKITDGELRLAGLNFALSSLKIAGGHNIANASAAALAALQAGIPLRAITEVLAEFSGLPHRMRLVRERAGVRFYNDSKATNVGATVAAIQGLKSDPSFRGKVVLLAGGKDKGGTYAPIADVLRGAGQAILFGAAAELIANALTDVPFIRVETMAESLAAAVARADAGDAVLLAPACSSFDQFTSYAHRGETFEMLVQQLPEEG